MSGQSKIFQGKCNQNLQGGLACELLLSQMSLFSSTRKSISLSLPPSALNTYKLSCQSCTVGSVLQVNHSHCPQPFRWHICPAHHAQPEQFQCQLRWLRALRAVLYGPVLGRHGVLPLQDRVFTCWIVNPSRALDNTMLVDILGFQTRRF